MHILYVPRMYPSVNDQYRGIFFEKQAIGMAKKDNVKISVLALNFLILKNYFSYKSKNIKTYFYNKDNVDIIFKQVFSLPKFYRLNLNIRNKLRMKMFKKYVEKFGLPDILHLHTYDAGDFAIEVKKKYGINYVLTEHLSGILPETDKYLFYDKVKKIYALSSLNMAVSKDFAKKMSEKFDVDFTFLPNFIDTDFFNLKPKTNKKTINFISVGDLKNIKNHQLLIKAFAKVFKNDRQKQLYIVGDGDEREFLQSLTNQLSVNQQIIFTGKLPPHQVKKLLHKSDFFVSSSKFESFGISTIEAMSCGLPVVATRNSGSETIITSNDLGILCEQNIDSLSSALLKITQIDYSPEKIREYVVNNFSEKVVTNRLLDIYKQFIN